MVLLDIGISISFGLMLLFFSRSVITENIGDVASSMEKERFFVLIGTRAREWWMLFSSLNPGSSRILTWKATLSWSKCLLIYTSPTPFWRPLVLCCVIQHLWFRPGFQLEILTLFYDVGNKIRVFIPLRICFEVKMECDYSVYWNYETSKASMALSRTWERFKCKGSCALDYV